MKVLLNGQNRGKTNGGQNNRLIMFGFKKRKSPDKVSKLILERIYGVLAFPRQNNNGVLPDSIIDSEYVIGFHMALLSSLYIGLTGDVNTKYPKDWSLVQIKVLTKVLGLSPTELMNRTLPLIENPSPVFNKGVVDGQEAFRNITNNDNNAFLKFNMTIKHLYQ